MNTCIERATRRYLDGRLFCCEDVARTLGIDKRHVNIRLYRVSQFTTRNHFIKIELVERVKTPKGHYINYYRRLK